MKNYLRHKNFISEDFLKDFQKKKEKKERYSVIYLLLLNVILLPKLIHFINSPNKIEIPEVKKVEKYICLESISEWIDEIDDTVFLANIKNGEGEFGVINKEKIYLLEEKEDFTVSSVKKSEESKNVILISKDDIYE